MHAQADPVHGQGTAVAHGLQRAHLQGRRRASALGRRAARCPSLLGHQRRHARRSRSRSRRRRRLQRGCLHTAGPNHGLRKHRFLRLAHRRVVDRPALAQNSDRIRKGHHFTKLVGDQQHGAFTPLGNSTHRAQHLIGLVRCKYRGGLVENQQARTQVKLLEQFQLLPLARSKFARAGVQVKLKRRALHEGAQSLALAGPVNHRRHAGGEQQVFGHRHARRQGEMLVHHANAQGARDKGVGNGLLAAVHQHAAFVGRLKAGHALDQGAFARAVFAQQCMYRTGGDFQAHLVQGG